MRAITLICLAIIVATPALATELYRWVDEQGRVHYSDRPREGAETVRLRDTGPAQTPPRAASRPSPAAASRPSPPRPPAMAYQSVEILSPTQDQVLWNIGSVLTVRVGIQPGLNPEHRIVVRYDGQPVEGWPAGALSHQIKEVYRGTHTVAASVTDASGNVIATGQAVTFHVKQTSALN